MTESAIERVGVIGAGQMGGGIAEVCARAGVDVVVFETTEALVTAGRNRISSSLERGVGAGKITERERDRAADNLRFTTALTDLADRQLVIEAVIEDENVKAVVRCSDRSGFVVNALLVPYLLAAIRMVEAGFATVADVDKAVVAGLSHPMGPLRLSDLIGLDTVKLIADKMYEEFKDSQYAPPPLLLRMVEAGRLGKKSGQGFYEY